nr:hypothetical protein [Tanacetum cinerariifolium]
MIYIFGVRTCFVYKLDPDSPEAAPQSPIQTPPVPQDKDEREPMFIQPHDLDYVSEPMYPRYIPLEDEHVLPAEEQPLPPVVSPTTESLAYVAESDPEEYEDDETEDGPDEEEEHFVPADSAIVTPTDELVSPPKGTKPVIPPPFTDTTTTGARITAEVERLLAIPTPPPSPLASLSPPSAGERLARCTAPSAFPSPPHVPIPLLPSSRRLTQIQTLRMASTQALIDAVTTALPSPPLPPPLYIPPHVDRRDDVPETEMPSRKRLCLSTPGSRYEIGESSTARPTGDPAETVPVIAPMTMGEDSRTRISQRVAMDSQRVDLLMEDRIAHQETILIVEEEAYAAREAWAHSVGLSQAVHSELQIHQEQVYAHEFQLQAHQTQLQLQGTLIQTQHSYIRLAFGCRRLRYQSFERLTVGVKHIW